MLPSASTVYGDGFIVRRLRNEGFETDVWYLVYDSVMPRLKASSQVRNQFLPRQILEDEVNI